MAESVPVVNRLLRVSAPWGQPVDWAEVAMVSDIGDSHDLNDDRCLVITSRDLGERATGALREFMLCLLADGATGSMFDLQTGDGAVGGPPVHAGWRASQLAQAAFVERFFNSAEIDILDRLKDGLCAADRALVDSAEGSLSTTLTALFLSEDGTACAASIGDSALLVLPPRRKTPGDRRLKKLGYEDTTSVGSGDTTLSSVNESELIEQWWPNKEGGDTSTRVKSGTFFVLLSDGISDNLPVDFIDKLLHRHPLDGATVGLPQHTRDRRLQAQRRGGGSTSELGLDNMSAIVVRYDGHRRLHRADVPRLQDTSLVTALGTRGGPMRMSGGQFGMVCLAGQELGASAAPAVIAHLIRSEQREDLPQRLSSAFLRAIPHGNQSHFAALVLDEQSSQHAFSSSGADMESLGFGIAQRSVAPARDSALQRFIYTPRVWASSLAALAMFALVSTAFATGTVRPAPPPVPTPAPGEPTPTPDTRPVLSFGGFQLAPPAVATTPTPAPAADASALNSVQLTLNVEPAPVAENPTAEPKPAPTQPPCRNIFGLLCGSRPPSPPRPPPVELPPAQIAPVPSPAPVEGPVGAGPRPGSNLDMALKIASVANDQFNRSLEEPVPTPAAGR